MPAFKIDELVDIFDGSHVRVKYKDVFDMKLFYDALHEYLLEHEWTAYDGDKEAWETYYGERIDQSGAKEIWIMWRLKKKAPGANLTYHLDFNFHCIAITKTEIVRDGNKFSTNKGECELIMRAFIQKDFLEDIKKKSPVLKPFAGLISKRMYDTDVEMRKKELYQEVYALQSWVKQWFKLKRYLPYEEHKTFWKSEAYPSHQKG